MKLEHLSPVGKHKHLLTKGATLDSTPESCTLLNLIQLNGCDSKIDFCVIIFWFMVLSEFLKAGIGLFKLTV